jgi:GNAT superfamily N-acetyltransferase
MAQIRPMREEDVEPLAELGLDADEHIRRSRGEPVQARPDLATVVRRFFLPLETDPDGAWVSEDERGLTGGAFAFMREGVWILSQLAVRPDVQSKGLGSALLRRTWAYGAAAKGRLIATSEDPRALRAYARLGLDVRPCIRAVGTPRGVEEPAGIRIGDARDIPFTEDVDRHVRRAAHGPDIHVLLDSDQTLLIAEDRGYAVVSERGGPRLLAAYDEAGARAVLQAVLARAGEREISVNWITEPQQWAIQTCLDARMDLRTDIGAIMSGGDVGPFHPYLPNGAYL